MQSDYSGETAEFEVEGHKYRVSLLNVEQCAIEASFTASRN